ncbi:LOW QUALITY PROTEIN: GDSL esterase/lipase At2g27360-like [Sesamum indicum]|uniref:LOW QUALITY PROTEIN: GDSL esterase/lipase At2g27360-like n=1 Tax=Sesamum indicum TaxID=4182 RepID=A0A6I9UDY7_SESIN|nr:LOW QUALITY PROTEIN: GDSL esterase/lipase At2g27360-like [Sesamum indicum]
MHSIEKRTLLVSLINLALFQTRKKMAVAYAIISILVASTAASASQCFESIISFGDSLADTGNFFLLSPPNKPPYCARPPYGRTFFHLPTGRSSDGRLVIDFIAEALGLPLVESYIAGKNAAEKGGRFSKGVNFAVAGATVLDTVFFDKRGIHNRVTNVTLGTQFDWFNQFLAVIPNGRKFVKNSLILVGEIGGNDYGNPLLLDIDPKAIRSFMPAVVNYIGSTIEELIKLGATTMLVPGVIPMGCLPALLTHYKTSSTEKDYHPTTGCLNWLNELSIYHNELLQKELSRLRHLHPHIAIIYADNYNAMMRFYLSPHQFGFAKESILRACCGGGGPYNFNGSALCGNLPRANCCENPSLYVNWDGLHCTEAANKWIAQGLWEGSYTHPHIKTICPSISSPAGFQYHHYY